MNESIGKVISGSTGGKIIIRLKSSSRVDVGDILRINNDDYTYFAKVTNVRIESLVPSQFIEDMAGQELEYEADLKLFDEKDRFYNVCEAKLLKLFQNGEFKPPRNMPKHFSDAFKINDKDFDFLNKAGEVSIGNLRLGTEELKNVKVKLPAEKLISHHVLVTAATGKGKSNFAKVFIRGLLYLSGQSSIILDPHNEYYGGKGLKGLRDHPERNKIVYFTPRHYDFPGSEQLIIHSSDIEPQDFLGILSLTQTQEEGIVTIHKEYGEDWINQLFNKDMNQIIEDVKGRIQRVTLLSLRRKFSYGMELEGSKGIVFSLEQRNEASIFEKIKNAVSNNKIIIIDTSLAGDEAERLIASAIVRRLLLLYRKTKQLNPSKFDQLPELLILFEEAPRVLGKEVLSNGTNIFEKIAREGRKFKVGLCAITQMPSLLPKEILSQMNTKIILGLTSPSDVNAVVESAPQNISDESTEIQILDKGEALITSPFIDFPLPVKVFKFEDVLKEDAQSKPKNPSIGIV